MGMKKIINLDEIEQKRTRKHIAQSILNALFFAEHNVCSISRKEIANVNLKNLKEEIQYVVPATPNSYNPRVFKLHIAYCTYSHNSKMEKSTKQRSLILLEWKWICNVSLQTVIHSTFGSQSPFIYFFFILYGFYFFFFVFVTCWIAQTKPKGRSVCIKFNRNEADILRLYTMKRMKKCSTFYRSFWADLSFVSSRSVFLGTMCSPRFGIQSCVNFSLE